MAQVVVTITSMQMEGASRRTTYERLAAPHHSGAYFWDQWSGVDNALTIHCLTHYWVYLEELISRPGRIWLHSVVTFFYPLMNSRFRTRAMMEETHFCSSSVFRVTGLLNPKSSECQSCFEKCLLLDLSRGMFHRGIQFDFFSSLSLGEVWSSLSEEPQNLKGTPLL